MAHYLGMKQCQESDLKPKFNEQPPKSQACHGKADATAQRHDVVTGYVVGISVILSMATWNEGIKGTRRSFCLAVITKQNLGEFLEENARNEMKITK